MLHLLQLRAFSCFESLPPDEKNVKGELPDKKEKEAGQRKKILLGYSGPPATHESY